MKISFIAFNGVQSLDIFGPMEVFALANEFSGKKFYETSLYTIGSQRIKTNSGIDIICNDVNDMPQSDIIIFCGGDEKTLIQLSQDQGIKNKLIEKTQSAKNICSICTGAFVLAYLGFLENKKATTHWRHSVKFRQLWPNVDLIENEIFVQDDNIYTSAGVSCGIDLCLHLVENDLGYDIAKSIAKELVLYLRRNGGQKQYSELLNLQYEDKNKISDLCQYILANPKGDFCVANLAQKVSMSERNFSRRFKIETNFSPSAFVEMARLSRAKSLLETTNLMINKIAHEVGFNNENNFFRSFMREYGISPNEYKKKFFKKAQS